MNAALSAFHMADWVWTTYHEDDPQKVADTARPLAYSLYLADNGYPDFRVIKDIAEAHKHLKLTVRTDDRVVLSAGATGLGRIGATTRRGLTGTTMAALPKLVIEQQDGTKRAFEDVIGNVINMWEDLIERDGL